MPFKKSDHADFQASSQLGINPYRVNGTWEAQAEQAGTAGAIYRNAMYDAFQAYMARDDIESRSSILARRDAVPGTIFWATQTNPGEVDNVTAGDESEV